MIGLSTNVTFRQPSTPRVKKSDTAISGVLVALPDPVVLAMAEIEGLDQVQRQRALTALPTLDAPLTPQSRELRVLDDLLARTGRTRKDGVRNLNAYAQLHNTQVDTELGDGEVLYFPKDPAAPPMAVPVAEVRPDGSLLVDNPVRVKEIVDDLEDLLLLDAKNLTRFGTALAAYDLNVAYGNEVLDRVQKRWETLDHGQATLTPLLKVGSDRAATEAIRGEFLKAIARHMPSTSTFDDFMAEPPDFVRDLWFQWVEHPQVTNVLANLAGYFANGGHTAYLRVVFDSDPTRDMVIGPHLEEFNPHDDITLLWAPGVSRAGQVELLEYAARRNTFAVLEASADLGIHQSPYPGDENGAGAWYGPHLVIRHPTAVDEAGNTRRSVVSPVGFVAAVMARTDMNRGIHKAPANEVIYGAEATSKKLPMDEVRLLFGSHRVNCIGRYSVKHRDQIVIWGDISTASQEDRSYVAASRTERQVARDLQRFLDGMMFEPNSQTERNNIIATITRYIARYGEAIQLIRADDLTTEDDEQEGRMVLDLALRIVKSTRQISIAIRPGSAAVGF